MFFFKYNDYILHIIDMETTSNIERQLSTLKNYLLFRNVLTSNEQLYTLIKTEVQSDIRKVSSLITNTVDDLIKKSVKGELVQHLNKWKPDLESYIRKDDIGRYSDKIVFGNGHIEDIKSKIMPSVSDIADNAVKACVNNHITEMKHKVHVMDSLLANVQNQTDKLVADYKQRSAPMITRASLSPDLTRYIRSLVSTESALHVDGVQKGVSRIDQDVRRMRAELELVQKLANLSAKNEHNSIYTSMKASLGTMAGKVDRIDSDLRNFDYNYMNLRGAPRYTSGMLSVDSIRGIEKNHLLKMTPDGVDISGPDAERMSICKRGDNSKGYSIHMFTNTGALSCSLKPTFDGTGYHVQSKRGILDFRDAFVDSTATTRLCVGDSVRCRIDRCVFAGHDIVITIAKHTLPSSSIKHFCNAKKGDRVAVYVEGAATQGVLLKEACSLGNIVTFQIVPENIDDALTLNKSLSDGPSIARVVVGDNVTTMADGTIQCKSIATNTIRAENVSMGHVSGDINVRNGSVNCDGCVISSSVDTQFISVGDLCVSSASLKIPRIDVQRALEEPDSDDGSVFNVEGSLMLRCDGKLRKLMTEDEVRVLVNDIIKENVHEFMR